MKLGRMNLVQGFIRNVKKIGFILKNSNLDISRY